MLTKQQSSSLASLAPSLGDTIFFISWLDRRSERKRCNDIPSAEIVCGIVAAAVLFSQRRCPRVPPVGNAVTKTACLEVDKYRMVVSARKGREYAEWISLHRTREKSTEEKRLRMLCCSKVQLCCPTWFYLYPMATCPRHLPTTR